ncbi:MAG: hypothetical protein R3C71_07030 [Candidatus Krumholzibacteriia bacterium]
MTPEFFTDRDLGKALPASLQAGGWVVHPYHEVFEREDVPDAEWLAVCGREGWIALSHDKTISFARRSPAALDAILASRTALIILRGHRTTRDMADSLLASRRVIEDFANRHDAPYIAKYYCSDDRSADGRRRPGRIELKYSASPD